MNNLAVLFERAGRLEDAEAYNREAMELLDPMWRVNPEVNGDMISRILGMRAELYGRLGRSRKDSCELARRAYHAAYDPKVIRSAEALIDEFCGEG